MQWFIDLLEDLAELTNFTSIELVFSVVLVALLQIFIVELLPLDRVKSRKRRQAAMQVARFLVAFTLSAIIVYGAISPVKPMFFGDVIFIATLAWLVPMAETVVTAITRQIKNGNRKYDDKTRTPPDRTGESGTDQ